MFKNAFTVLELVVVIAVIALLGTLTTVSVQSITGKARDSRRLKDIDNIRTALNLYKQEAGFYPTSLTGGEPLIGLSGQTYLKEVPYGVTDKDCISGYTYLQKNNGFNYQLNYCLSSRVGDLGPGENIATSGALDSPCLADCTGKCGGSSDGCGGTCPDTCIGKCGGDNGCGVTCPNTCSGGTPYCASDNATCLAYVDCPTAVCGDCSTVTCGQTCTTNVTVNGTSTTETYGTVQVGSQCWMTKNVNIGTKTTGGSCTNNNLIERWCPGPNNTTVDGTEADCSTYGGLYAWHEAMYLPLSFDTNWFTGYSGTGASAKRQGICPKGWHVPSDAEFVTLEKALDSGVTDAVSYYADCSSSCSGGTAGYRGTNSWTAGAGARLFCTATGLPVASCSATAAAVVAPKFLRGGHWYTYYYARDASVSIWVSSQASATYAWSRGLIPDVSPQSYRTSTPKTKGFQVRCLKD